MAGVIEGLLDCIKHVELEKSIEVEKQLTVMCTLKNQRNQQSGMNNCNAIIKNNYLIIGNMLNTQNTEWEV